MAGQPCPTGCGGTVKPGHLTCITCWHEIPGELRREVTRTWRALERIRGSARRNGKAYTGNGMTPSARSSPRRAAPSATKRPRS